MGWKRSAMLLVFVLAATPAWAQQTLLTESFDRGAAGWGLHGMWGVDSSPRSMPGGSAFSGTQSLNFNNGVDYAGLARGACQSPEVVAQAGAEHVIRFRCNYRTETTGTRYDRRSVRIRVFGTTVADHFLSSLSTALPEDRCSAMGIWHTHELHVTMPFTRHAPRLRVEFVFDSVDDEYNDYAGWFVDDFAVEVLAPAAPQEFTSVSYTTNTFRDLRAEVRIADDRSVEIRRSQPNVRFALVSGQATDAEWQALNRAIHDANLAQIPAYIPDPNVYIVQPTTFVLAVASQISANDHTVSGNAGVHGQWASQLSPVVAAIRAIQTRLLSGSGDDHGDTRQTATSLSLDPIASATSGQIDPPGDVDFFQFADIMPMIAIFPPPQKTYIIETTVPSGMDTVIDLYAGDGTLLDTNDDGGAGLASRIVYTGPQGSVFYVKVRHYSAQKTGGYTIRVQHGLNPPTPMPVQDDHSNSPQGATVLEVGDPATTGSIDPQGDVDFFHLSPVVIAIFPPPQATFTIQTTVVGDMDTILELYDGDGTTLLKSNDDAPGLGLASKVVYSGLLAGPYYVKVRHYSSTGTGDYTVRVTTTP